jgi:PAS domain S-box-containing protein
MGSIATDQLLRAIVESATDFAIITIDRDGAVTSWNTGAERLLGWTDDEIVGHDSRIFFTREDRAAGKPEQEMRGALADGRAEDERWHVRKDDSRFWGSGTLMPLQERSLGFVKILRDRTEQHQANQELQQSIGRLRDSEERFRLLATSIPQLVFRSRGTGARTWGSPQWEVYAGLSDARSRDFQWLDAVHPDDRDATLEAWRRAQETGEYYVEHRIKRAADGEYRWYQTRAVPIARISGEWVGTSTDIHDLRTLQHRQQVIVAEIHHRTRNLLALVQATARQTLRRSSSLEEFGREFDGRLHADDRRPGACRDSRRR